VREIDQLSRTSQLRQTITTDAMTATHHDYESLRDTVSKYSAACATPQRTTPNAKSLSVRKVNEPRTIESTGRATSEQRYSIQSVFLAK